MNLAHMWAGKNLDSNVYIYANDIMEAMDIVKKKVRWHKKSKYSLFPCTAEEVISIVGDLQSWSPMSLKKFKKQWFCYGYVR